MRSTGTRLARKLVEDGPMTTALEAEKKLEILKKPVRLDLSMNDLRILVGCFRAVAYFMKLDDEPYLDTDALDLQQRLEHKYEELLGRNGSRRS
jgi:hypothetical protein